MTTLKKRHSGTKEKPNESQTLRPSRVVLFKLIFFTVRIFIGKVHKLLFILEKIYFIFS